MNQPAIASEPQDFLSLSLEDLKFLQKHLTGQIETIDSRERLYHYQAFPKQKEFHDLGKRYRERMLMAANQVGKTWAAAMETAMHLTGWYPDWWDGLRFDRPVRWMAGSESSELTKKGVQRLLLGNPEDESSWGTAAIPKALLDDVQRRQSPVPNCVGTIAVKRHDGKGKSTIQLQAYEQGRSKWQADTVDGVWFDEEPPEDVYTEGLTRTNIRMGPVYTTLTPLKGMSSVVERFYPYPTIPSACLIQMTLDDAPQYTEDQRRAIESTYKSEERKTRTKGIPYFGSGRVFTGIDEDQIKIPSMPIPEHWAWICGLDFGWDHPSAGVALAHDRDTDILYVTAGYRAREHTPAMFAAAVKPWGEWKPWAWPHDGLAHDKGSGDQLAKLYRDHGLNMLPERATFVDGGNGLEAGVAEMLERMQTGRLKVFAHLTEWFAEFNFYHRMEGIIVPERDDLISATRYGVMMRRFAKTKAEMKPKRQLQQSMGIPTSNGWMG